MKEFMDLFEKISEELDGAYEYAEEAIRLHDSDYERAGMYLEMSKQELNHVDRLHEMIKKIIKKFHAEGGEIPRGMDEIYDWQHKKMMQCVAKVKYLHGLFK